MRVKVMQLLRAVMVSFFGYLPRGLAGPVSRALGGLAYRLDKKGRKRAVEQMKKAEVGADDKEREAIAKAVYRHLALTILEVLWTAKHMHRALEGVDWEGTEHLEAGYAGGKGIVGLSMHYGNWELSGVAMGLAYPGTGTIVREQDDEGLDRILAGNRKAAGLTLFPNRSDQGPVMAAHLANNHLLGILMDVYASRKHPPVPFLGVPTPTFLGPAAIARESGAPVVIIHAQRKAPFRHKMVIDPVPVTWTENREEDLLRATALFNEKISERIRREPTQWLWIMKRWKDDITPG